MLPTIDCIPAANWPEKNWSTAPPARRMSRTISFRAPAAPYTTRLYWVASAIRWTTIRSMSTYFPFFFGGIRLTTGGFLSPGFLNPVAASQAALDADTFFGSYRFPFG